MKFLSLAIIFSLLLISIFGFLDFILMNHNGQGNCPAVLLLGNIGGCPLKSNALAIIFHHLSSLQSLMQSTAAILIIILALFFVFFSILVEILSKMIVNAQKKQSELYSLTKQKKLFLYWFALHNKRDPYLLF